jgi:20S proteasome alpha/beta subunit
MTLIIGIKCSDGIVLGADGAATFGVMGDHTIRQPVRRKLWLLGTQMVVGVSGPVGIGQRFSAHLEEFQQQGIPINAQQRLHFHQLRPHQVMQVLRDVLWNIIRPEVEIARTMAQALGQPAPLQSALCQSVVCMLVGGEPSLFSFDQQGSPEQASDDPPFVTLGSGQRIADPFLAFLRRIYWPQRLPNVEQGVFSAVWALHQAIETNPGGVGPPMQIATVSREDGGEWRAQEMPEARWDEHLQFIRTLESEMAHLPRRLQQGTGEVPPPPAPPPVVPPEREG